VSDNTATEEDGGGILGVGTLSLKDSTVAYNTARQRGGGIFFESDPAPLTLSGSLVVDNQATDGGGLFIFQGGTVNLTASTIANNRPNNCAGNFSC